MRDGWEEVTIGEIAEVVAGSTPSTREPSYWGGGIPWIVPSEVTRQEGQRITSTDRTITNAGLAAIRRPILPTDTVLLTSRATVGAVALAGIPMAINQGFAALVTGPRVLPEFLMYWCQANRSTFESLAGGSTFPEVGRPSVRSVRLLLPPVAEQRRIVDLMSAVGAAAELSRAAIESARAAFRSMRDTRIARHWSARLQPLGAVLERTRRPLPVTQAGRYSEIGIRSHGKGIFHKPPVLGQSLGSKAVFGIEPGDLVFNIVFAWEGAVAVAGPSEAGRCGSHRFPTYLARPDVNVNYVRHVLLSPRGLALLGLASPGSAGRNRTLNQSSLMRSPIPVPRLDEQERFVRDLDGIEAVTAAHAGNLRALDRLRDALLADLLAGDHEIPVSYDRFLDGAA